MFSYILFPAFQLLGAYNDMAQGENKKEKLFTGGGQTKKVTPSTSQQGGTLAAGQGCLGVTAQLVDPKFKANLGGHFFDRRGFPCKPKQTRSIPLKRLRREPPVEVHTKPDCGVDNGNCARTDCNCCCASCLRTTRRTTNNKGSNRLCVCVCVCVRVFLTPRGLCVLSTEKGFFCLLP